MHKYFVFMSKLSHVLLRLFSKQSFFLTQLDRLLPPDVDFVAQVLFRCQFLLCLDEVVLHTFHFPTQMLQLDTYLVNVIVSTTRGISTIKHLASSYEL